MTGKGNTRKASDKNNSHLNPPISQFWSIIKKAELVEFVVIPG